MFTIISFHWETCRQKLELWGCSPTLYWVWETNFMHAKPLASEVPLCDWKGHLHTPVQCTAFHSVRKERWEKQESAMMYFIKSKLWGLLQALRWERWQCGWKCFVVLKKDLEKRTKHWIKQMVRIYNRIGSLNRQFYPLLLKIVYNTFKNNIDSTAQ